MDLRQLRHFVKTCEMKSINKAASALNMSQPSLSHSIKTLEQSLGVNLLNRGGSGISLTQHGEQFHDHAIHILREAEKAIEDMAMLSGRGDSQLTVGVMSAFSQSFLSRVLEKFLKIQPNVCISSHSFISNLENYENNLKNSSWDLVLSLANENLIENPSIHSDLLTKSVSSVYCGAQHPLSGVKNVTPDKMAQYGWVTSLNDAGERLLARFFEKYGLSFQIRARASSINQMTSFVKSAPLLCIVPEVSVVDDLSAGSVVRVDQDDLRAEANIMLAYSKLASRSLPMREFMRLCKEEVHSRLLEARK